MSPRSGDQGVSVALRRLSGILTRNRVKRELKLGEYYEKGSERKKRLAVERHRRRFQDLVSLSVGRGDRRMGADACCGNYRFDKRLSLCRLFVIGRREAGAVQTVRDV